MIMKKYVNLLILCCFLILPGCAREDPQILPTQSAEVLEQQVEQASANLQQNLEIDDAQLDDVSVAQVQTYEDETIVRYVQTYRGVEIYGSSMVATSSDEEFLSGTYYDLSDAFGDEFDTLVEEASTVPKWMESTEFIFVDTESVHPVIYITEDGQAIVARSFQLQIQAQSSMEIIEFVTDLAGQTLYEYSSLTTLDGFNTVSVDDNSCAIVKENNIYYAYNEEYNFYGINKVYKKSSQFDVEDYSEVRNKTRYLICNEDLAYSKKSSNWTSGDAKLILDAMTAYYNVADWYYKTFGYRGLNGSNGLSAIVVCKDMGRTVAANNSNILIMIQPNVLTEPEVLAHEYGHSVFNRLTGNNRPVKNETAALAEAISDTLGALYMHDGNWHLAESFGDKSKNIPAENRTMDDYRYDNDVKILGWYIDWYNNMLEAGSELFGVNRSSTDQQYENSYIVSNTLYKIWREVFKKDYDTFGEVLFRSLRYLPSNADFQDFREAFLYAMRLSYPAEKVAAAQGCFSNAGIEQKKHSYIERIQKQTAGSDEVTLEEIMSLPYKRIKNMVWDEFYVSSSFDTPDTWGVQCSIGECYYTIYYYGYDFEDKDALPSQVSGQDFRKTGRKMTICDVIRTGMTYEEIASVADVPEPVLTQAGWTTSFPLNYYFVRLFFEGDTEPGELHSAEISLDEYEGNPDTAGPDSEMTTRYMLAYCLADYGTIYADFGGSSYTNPGIYRDGGNIWSCTCMLGEGLSLVFDFASDYEDPTAMPIYARIDDLLYWSGSTTGAALCPGLSMGMTYAEAAATIGLTPLEWAPEQTWSEPVYLSYGGDAGCALELYFIGSSEETAVLVSVNAIPIG